MIQLVLAFAAQGEVVYAHPSSGLFFEWFVARPNGLIHRLVQRGEKDPLPLTLEPGVVAANEQLWQQRWTGTLGTLAEQAKSETSLRPPLGLAVARQAEIDGRAEPGPRRPWARSIPNP